LRTLPEFTVSNFGEAVAAVLRAIAQNDLSESQSRH
jgi:hypothetical protein